MSFNLKLDDRFKVRQATGTSRLRPAMPEKQTVRRQGFSPALTMATAAIISAVSVATFVVIASY